jgi:hypothetical protein
VGTVQEWEARRYYIVSKMGKVEHCHLLVTISEAKSPKTL